MIADFPLRGYFRLAICFVKGKKSHSHNVEMERRHFYFKSFVMMLLLTYLDPREHEAACMCVRGVHVLDVTM